MKSEPDPTAAKPEKPAAKSETPGSDEEPVNPPWSLTKTL